MRPHSLLVLDAPPAYLAEVPDVALLRKDTASRAADGILDALRRREIYARPTLAQVEAERVRRGLCSGVVIGTARAAPRPLVLPMPSHVTAEDVREEGRRNRARIEKALGDLAGDTPAVYALGFEVADELRAEERAA